jgi:uncharacterized protein YaiE (UPF0345 family)
LKNFENVTVAKKGNSYYDGKVTSRTLTFADGSVKTLGVMQVGDYEFGTSQHELMEITSGELQVKLPNSSVWRTMKAGDDFEIEANEKFQVRVKELTDYCCSYS